MTSTVIRVARPGDEDGILRLLAGLAEYEGEPGAVVQTPEGLGALLFAEHPCLFAHIAEHDDNLVAVALWFVRRSTWSGQQSIYLEDLFVDASVRGGGIAAGLFRALAREAEARGCVRIDWEVLGWNDLAKRFYARIGGRHTDTPEAWRLDGDALRAMRGG